MFPNILNKNIQNSTITDEETSEIVFKKSSENLLKITQKYLNNSVEFGKKRSTN